MKKEHRDIIVSRFETYGDDFRFDDCKAICNIAVNIKEKTISFTLESGDIPSLYVILMAMSVNSHWLNIVDSFEEPADMSRYFLLTRWISFEASDYYLCHEGADGVPIIDKCLVKHSSGSGICSCILSPLEYSILIDYDFRFKSSTIKSRMKELRDDYKLRYLK